MEEGEEEGEEQKGAKAKRHRVSGEWREEEGKTKNNKKIIINKIR